MDLTDDTSFFRSHLRVTIYLSIYLRWLTIFYMDNACQGKLLCYFNFRLIDTGVNPSWLDFLSGNVSEASRVYSNRFW